MKILHWDEMFHPTFGYQINLLAKFQAKAGHEVIIITSDQIENHPTFYKYGTNVDIRTEDEKFSQQYGVKIIRLPIHGVVSGRVIYKPGFIKKILDEKPDVILCHTNDTLSAIKITRNYKKINLPVVFDNHMLEMASKNPLRRLFRFYFKMFVKPTIVKNQLIVIRTQDDNYVNKELGIPTNLTPFISFGSDTSLFKPDESTKARFREKYGISNNDFVVIYAGKLTEAKGAKILAQSMDTINYNRRTIVFLIVGNTNGTYENEARQMMENAKVRTIFFPTQKYIELHSLYQASDLCVFPKQCSLSFYDAQACGLPVITEDNNINIERLSHNNGLVYRAGDVCDLRNKIIQFADMSVEEYNVISQNAYNFVRDGYDYKDIAEKYTKVLIDEYTRFQEKRRLE